MTNVEKVMNSTDEAAATRLAPLIPMNKKDVIRAALYGAFVGAMLTVLYILLSRVSSTVLCRGDSSLCESAPQYAVAISMVLVSIGGLMLLSLARIYRPLFVVIASSVALWGLQTYLSLLPWYWALVGMTVICAVAYALFTWLARLRSFILCLVASVVVIVAVRLIIAG